MTQTPQRRGFNDAVTRFWSVAAPAYNLPFLQQWVYRPAHDEVIAQLRDHQADLQKKKTALQSDLDKLVEALAF